MRNLNFKIVAVLLILISGFSVAQKLDRSVVPQPGPAPVINIPDAQTFTLKNGLKVFVVPNNKLPLVAFNLIVDRDPILEKENAGYISVAGQLMRTGTTTRTKDQIDNEIDLIGATLNASSSSIYASSLKKNVPKLLELMSDITINAKFKQDELDKILQRTKSGLAARKENPDQISQVVRKKVYYGEGHPYSESETESSVKNITLELCQNYYNNFFRPNISYLAVVGDITVKEAQELVEKYFSKWEAKDVPKFSFNQPTAPIVSKISLVDRPNSVQSTIVVGHPINLPRNSPDVLKASVTNTILGGGVFRLFENLREKHGYTYGAYSMLGTDELVGHFSVFTSTRNEVTDSAVGQILFEMKRIRNEAVPEDELQKAINYMSGSFALSLENPQTIANFAVNIDRYKLPKNFYKDYLKNISVITSEDVKAAAAKFIRPDNSHIIVVGKAAEIADKLKRFSVTKIDYYDADGNKVDIAALKIPAGLTAKEVIDRHLVAIGGRENILKIKDKTTKMSTTFNGMKLNIELLQKAPNKLKQTTSFSGQEQVTIFDGERGIQKTMMGTQEVLGKELEVFKAEASMDLLLDLEKHNVKAELKSMEKIGGKDAYKIELVFPLGTIVAQYFDVESGLKVRDVKEVETPQGPMSISTDYSDYKEIEGIKFPSVVKQNLGPMVFEMKVDSVLINTGLSDNLFVITK